ncbi:hypothetical protein Bbelb_273830 [Branchiostoma belcheri]|nr:hypothetical protein Bbelb_273830 [Branchiostoma belcheri]
MAHTHVTSVANASAVEGRRNSTANPRETQRARLGKHRYHRHVFPFTLLHEACAHAHGVAFLKLQTPTRSTSFCNRNLNRYVGLWNQILTTTPSTATALSIYDKECGTVNAHDTTSGLSHCCRAYVAQRVQKWRWAPPLRSTRSEKGPSSSVLPGR